MYPLYSTAFVSPVVISSGSAHDIHRRSHLQSSGRRCSTVHHHSAQLKATAAPTGEKDDFLERIRSINRVDETSPTVDQVALLVTMIRDDPNPQVRYAAISRLSNVNREADGVSQKLQDVLDAARKALTTDAEPSCRSAAADLIAGLKLNDGFEDLINVFNETTVVQFNCDHTLCGTSLTSRHRCNITSYSALVLSFYGRPH